ILVQTRLREPDEALRSVNQALDLYREAVRDHADRPDLRHLLGGTLDSLSHVLTLLGRHAEAENALRQAIEQAQAAVEQAPQVVAYREWLGNHYFNLAVLLEIHRGRPAEALAARREA